MRCRFAKHCPHFQPKGVICNDDFEAVEQGYCGIATQFKKIEWIDVRELR